MNQHDCTIENAPKFLDWLRTRGGLALWRSLNLSNPVTWTCPLNDADGKVKAKPYYHSDSQPYRVITDSDEVLVVKDKEVQRFHVAVRGSKNGLQFKLTDASSQKVKQAVKKHGEHAYHVFDYETQEAVIMAPDGTLTLTQWAALNNL